MKILRSWRNVIIGTMFICMSFTPVSHADEVDDLIEQLSGPPEVRQHAFRQLALKGDHRAVKPLIDLVNGEIEQVIRNKGGGYTAVGSLGMLRKYKGEGQPGYDPKTIKAIDQEVSRLVERLKTSQNTREKAELVFVLGELGSPVAAEILVQLLGDGSLRNIVFSALSRMRNRKTMDAMREWALIRKDPEDVVRVLQILVKMQIRYARHVAREIMNKHPDPKVRKSAKKAVAELDEIIKLKEQRKTNR